MLCFDYCHMGKSKFAARLHPSSKRKPSKRKQKLTLKKQKHKIEFLQCIVHSILNTIPTMLHTQIQREKDNKERSQMLEPADKDFKATI